MSIILFIAILVVLVLVHEFGHFVVAKKSGIRVDEFGVGFPPKLWGKKKGETEYTVNLLPIGGFVKIFGENPDDESMNGPDAARSFVNKPKRVQAAVIAAGVVFNVLFAWFLISVGFMIGLPTSVDATPAGKTLQDVALVVTDILPRSPAEEAGLRVGDKINSLKANDAEPVLMSGVLDLQEFIATSGDQDITLSFVRGKQPAEEITVRPAEGILDRPAIGIAMDEIGLLRLPVHLALWEGAKLTVVLTKATAVGLASFFGGLLTASADLSGVAGPVGIAGIVGDASEFGFVYLLTLVALISINLAIINLVPFPALDGGRLLFLLIEAVKGSPIKPIVANMVNMIGFALLILLMVVITYNDIARIVTG